MLGFVFPKKYKHFDKVQSDTDPPPVGVEIKRFRPGKNSQDISFNDSSSAKAIIMNFR